MPYNSSCPFTHAIFCSILDAIFNAIFVACEQTSGHFGAICHRDIAEVKNLDATWWRCLGNRRSKYRILIALKSPQKMHEKSEVQTGLYLAVDQIRPVVYNTPRGDSDQV